MRPYDAKSTDQVCAMRTDHFDVGDFWILGDGYRVTIAQQKTGEPASQSITIPRAEFNRLIDWYMREQKAKAA